MTDPAWLWPFLIGAAALPVVPRLTRAVRENVARRQDDFAVFYHTTQRLFWRDGDPYPLGRGAPNLNPPHAHVLFAPLLRSDRSVAYAAWLCASIVMLVLSAAIIVRTLPERPSLASLVLAVALVSGSGLAMASAASGQIYAVLTLPLTVAWVQARQQHDVLAGAIVGGLATVKPLLAVLMVGWAREGNWLALSSAVIAGCVVMATGLLAFGRQPYEAWFRSLSRLVGSGHFRDGAIMQALARVFTHNGHFPPLVCAPRLIVPLWVTLSVLVLSVSLAELPSDIDKLWLRLLSASLLISPKGWLYAGWWLGGPALLVASTGPLQATVLVGLAAGCLWLPDRAPTWGQPSAVLGLLWGSLYLWTWGCLWLATW